MTTLPNQEIFKKLFVGLPVESSELFQTIKGFSPTGAPKILKKTPENLKKFRLFIRSTTNESPRQQYKRKKESKHSDSSVVSLETD